MARHDTAQCVDATHVSHAHIGHTPRDSVVDYIMATMPLGVTIHIRCLSEKCVEF